METKNSFISKLRWHTHELHTRLEQAAISSKITSAQVSLADYIRYLQKIYAFHKGVEEIVFPKVATCVPDLSLRHKAHLIEKDLRQLGAPAQYNTWLTPDNVLNEGFSMGILYVAEGSTLGGRVLLKNIDKHIGIAAQGALHFLQAYQADTKDRWLHFLGSLEAFRQKHPEECIVEGAKFGFQKTYELLS